MDFHPALHNISEEDKEFITRNLGDTNKKNERSSVSLLLYKIYIGTTILDLSTETRFISFVIFYRYLCQYHILYDSYSPSVDGHNDNRCNSSDERLSHPQKHLGKIAAAALFLACKITNENRRIRDVINVYHILKFDHWSGLLLSLPPSSLSVSVPSRTGNFKSKKKIDNGVKQKGKYSPDEGEEENMAILLNCRNNPPPLDEEYWKFKEEIVKIEHHLLRVLNFDVHNMVISPYRIVVSIIEQIINLIVDEETNSIGDYESTNIELDQHAIFQQTLKHAWRRINDAIFCIDAMAVKNSDLACGAIALAFEKEGNTANDRHNKILQHIHKFCWWQWVDVNFHEVNAAKATLTEATESLSQLRM